MRYGLELYTLEGKKVFHKTGGEDVIIQGLPAGLYIAYWTKDGRSKSSKLMLVRIVLFVLLIITPIIGVAQSFEEYQTTRANVRLSATNVGTFGNAFRGYRDGSGTPSMEYPAGSGIEHLFEGGLWFGGIDNGVVRVSTSAYDAPQGYAPGRGGFEFNATQGVNVVQKSSLRSSPNYRVDAVSHQDFVCSFNDSEILVPGTKYSN